MILDCDTEAGQIIATLLRERDALRIEVERLSRKRESLRFWLTEAINEWEYAASYKGEHFREKHGDDAKILALREKLAETEEDARRSTEAQPKEGG
jgi:hypothetical protein